VKYTFQPKYKQPLYNSYRLEELNSMTLMQLRDICEREDIIHAALDRQDREELIQLIMSFRGSRERFLIQTPNNEGVRRLQEEFGRVTLRELPVADLNAPSKISVYTGLDTGFFDDYRINHCPDLETVNALVLDQQGGVCALLSVVKYPGHPQYLFLTRSASFPVNAASMQDCRLLLCPQKLSDMVTSLYDGIITTLPSEIYVYTVPLLEFEVCTPVEAPMPLAIDFGTSNTAAGMYLNRNYYHKIEDHIKPGLLQPDSVNYVEFLNTGGETLPVLPTVIAVDRIEGHRVSWQYGFNAESMAVRGYQGQGGAVFFDLKRWVANYEVEEALSDSMGRQVNLKRKSIIQAYLNYVIKSAEQRFKCRFKKLFLSYPVKQRERFVALYKEILNSYDLMEDETFDESIAVLYSIIGNFIDRKIYQENTDYHALILDCGGGTTDQSSAAFRIRRGRIAYEINISTAYENGDTDFGGNNLTFRIMQLLKIEAARQLSGGGRSLEELISQLSFDQYRAIDEHGRAVVYQEIEEAYNRTETIIPTRYREYQYSGRDEYYKVYNNFYYLFSLAERVKKAFFEKSQILRIAVSSEDIAPQPDTFLVRAQRWKLATRLTGGDLSVQKIFPLISINTNQVSAVFQGDIYDVFRRFVGRLYEDKQLSQYQIVKLTGQSCKIGLFRDSLKEFIPGSMISQGQNLPGSQFQLKLTCLEGVVRYLRDKAMGLAKVEIKYGAPAWPYILTAYTHDQEKVTLIHSLDRKRIAGMISRHFASTEVEFTLSDARGQERYIYHIACNPDDFIQVTYEEIEKLYQEHIPQAEVDVIENGEVRYFVWADPAKWGFALVAIMRKNEELSISPMQSFAFENEGWMVNYFDGTH